MTTPCFQQFCAGSTPIEVAAFCFAIIGSAFAFWQWWRSCRVSRAEHLNAILERYSDKKMTDMFYRLVNNSSYGGGDSEVFYQGGLRFRTIKGKKSPDDDICECDIDSMLILFSQICYEHECGTISKREFAFFSFQIRRTLAHEQFRQYLLDFAEYCGKYRIGCPYLALIREGVNVERAWYERALGFLHHGCYHKFINKLRKLLP